MVQDPGTPARPHHLRPLNPPQPVQVLLQNDLPAALLSGETSVPVERIEDVWHIDDEWWREPVERRYYRVLLATGALHTIYHDRHRDRWYEQTY